MRQEIYEVKLRQASVLRAIAAENDSQLLKWDVQRHSLIYWLGILMEEVGEVAEAVMIASPDASQIEEDLLDRIYQLGLRAKAHIEGVEPDGISRINAAVKPIDLYKEVVQVGAVAVAMAESFKATTLATEVAA